MLQNSTSILRIIILILVSSTSITAQWNLLNKPGNGVILDAQFVSDQIVFVAGANGVFQSANGGLTWNQSNQFQTLATGGLLENIWFSASIFHDIHFLNEEIGFAAGWTLVSNSEIIIKTVDGGSTWSKVYSGQEPGNEIGEGITSIQFVDNLVGYASSFQGRILRTSNGGQSWSLLTTGTTSDLVGLQFFDVNNGIAFGEKDFFRTSNGGVSWIKTQIPYSRTAMTFHFLDLNTGFLSTEEGRLLRTHDGGTSWSEHLMSMFISDISFADNMTGYAVGRGLFKTTDGGLTWSLQKQSISSEFKVISFHNGSIGLAGNFDGEIYKTSNGGNDVAPEVSITTFSPQQGLPGTSISISGLNLNYVHSVYVSGLPAVFSAEPNTLSTVVPVGAVSDEKIELRSLDGSVFSSTNLTLIKTPYFYSFSPLYGTTGSVITLSGYNLSGTTSVKFNGISAEFNVVDNSTITTTVPSGNSTGNIEIKTPFGIVINNTIFRKYDIPVITSFSPLTNYRDGSIFIEGSNFLNLSQVELNGTVVPLSLVSDNLIIVAGLPAEATSGKFSIKNPGAIGYSQDIFTVKEGSPATTITGFTPTSGSVGEQISIIGKDLYSLTKIKLNDIELNFQIISDTEVITEIPIFSATGVLEAYNKQGNRIPSVNTPFTVLPGDAIPVIFGFTPASGVLQSKVTIEGKNLYNVGGVYFNGVRSDFITRIGLNKLSTEVPTYGSTGKIGLQYGILSVHDTVKSTQNYVVIPNYCVPSRVYSTFIRMNTLSIGEEYYKNDDPNNNKLFYDFTDRIVEGKPGSTISLFTNAGGLDYGTLYTQLVFMVYVDWNNNMDFDSNELMHVSERRDGNQNNFSSFDVPANAPLTGAYRMRVQTRQFYGEWTNPTACDFGTGVGIAHDLTLQMVSTFTFGKPSVSLVVPATVTYGTKISITGDNLKDTEKVFIDDIATLFSFNTATNVLEVTVPVGSINGEIVIVTKGGTLKVNDPLDVVQPPLIGSVDPQQDTVGANVSLFVPDYKSGQSITNVYLNGTEVEFHLETSNYIIAKVPSAATSGKFSVKNQFGIYESSAIFTIIRDPTISSFFPQSGQMGETIVINGTEFNDVMWVTFNGRPTKKFTVLSTTQISVMIPYGASHGKIGVINRKSTAISSNDFTVLKSEGESTFLEIPSFYYDSLWLQAPILNKVADLDGDGLVDLVVGGVARNLKGTNQYFINEITIYKNLGGGKFGETNTRFIGTEFELADFNGDGRVDIVTGYGASCYIYLNREEDFDESPIVISPGFMDPNIWSYTFPRLQRVTDYDNDGDLDIIIAGNAIGWYENVNGGLFTLRYIMAADSEWGYAFFDFDKDGDIDFVNGRKMFVNQGGNYIAKDLFESERYYSWTVTDYNADGYPDLIGTGYTEYVHLYNNVNGQSFEKVDFPEIRNVYNLSWGDFYNDGIAGVIARHWIIQSGEVNIELFSLLSPKNVALRESIQMPPGSESLSTFTMIDFDNDSDLDIFTVLDHGNGSFTSPRLFENQTRINNTGAFNAPPLPPSALTFEKISDTEVLLKWNNGSDDHTPVASLNYNLLVIDKNRGLRKLVPMPLGTPYGNVGMTNKWRLNTLDPNISYSFQVQAIDQGYRASEFSTEVQFKLGVTIPAPSELKDTATGTRSIKLQWKDNSVTETGFNIEYRKSDDLDFTLLASVNENVNQYAAGELDCHHDYEFRVQAFDIESSSNFSDTAFVQTLSVPALNILGDLSFCETESTTLNATPGFDSYLWNTGSTSSSIIVVIPAAYSVVASDQEGCHETKVVLVTQKPLPIATINVLNNQLIASNADSYEWYKDGELQSGTEKILQLTSSGLYKVKVTIAGCSSFSEEISAIITGIEDASAEFLRISPNPTSGHFSIQLSAREGKLTIVNPMGQEIFSDTLNKSQKEIRLDFSNKSDGLYLINVNNDNKMQSYRFVLRK